MKIFSYLFWTLVVLIGVSFAALNSRSVEIHYYVGRADIYLPLLMLFELALGVLLGIFAMLPKLFKLKAALKQSQQAYKKLSEKGD